MTTLDDRRGAIHVHSNYSDGTGTIPRIIEAARNARLDFVMLNDHSTRRLHEEGWQGWHDGVLVIVAAEVGSPRLRHTLVMGLDDVHGLVKMPLEEGLARVRAMGGYSFVAHPRGTRVIGMSMPPWTAWDNPHYVGLEVWSFMHDWIEEFRWRRVRSFYLDPLGKITGPHPELLATWDRVAQTRHVSGIGSLDAHARPLIFPWMKFFPYDLLFGTTLTHVLIEPFSGDGEADARAVIRALVEGRCYVGYHVLGDPGGFRFSAGSATGEVDMGGEVRLRDGPVFFVQVPLPGQIRLVACGEEAGLTEGRHAQFRPVHRGPHRIEVRRDCRPWIFSNHIYVT